MNISCHILLTVDEQSMRTLDIWQINTCQLRKYIICDHRIPYPVHTHYIYEKHFPSFHIERTDRDVTYNPDDEHQLKSRGGCMVLTSPDIPARKVKESSFSNGNCEILTVEIPTIKTAVIVIYRPSGKNYSLQKFAEVLGKARNYLSDKKKKDELENIILAGDFNFNSKIVNWERSDNGLVPNYTHGTCDLKRGFSLLLDLVEDFNLEQMVDKLTRKASLLDLIFTNNTGCMSECLVTELEPLSDHKLVHTTIHTSHNVTKGSNTCDKAPKPCISQYDLKGANMELLRKNMEEHNWVQTLNVCQDVEKLNEVFAQALCNICDKSNVAKFPERQRGLPNFNKQVQNAVSKLNKERVKLDKLISQEDTTSGDIERFQARIVVINEEIETLYDNERQRIERRAIDNIAGDVKAFYQYANSFRKSKAKIGPLKSGHTYQSGEKEMAEILSRQYQSVFTVPNDGSYRFKEVVCEILHDIDITPEQFEEAMCAMKASSAPGPDGIAAFFFKNFAKELSLPIADIWRRSLDSSKMPEGHITAAITPIFKSDDKSDPANYRPVSLTNHLTKVFERVLRKHLVAHLEIQDLMNNTQHGFRDGRSTITQLLSYYDSILSMMEEGHHVHAIYLDFAKAFDKVDHFILLTKVEAYGIKGKILNWLRTFLTTRSQKVKVGDYVSEEVKVISGVPQGSVLGPLLFIIYMIDITDGIQHVMVGSFADDTKNWQITSCKFFQQELSKMYQWAEENNSFFNSKKFVKMTFGDEYDDTPFLKPDGNIIATKTHVKDLGVYMSSDAKFDHHINSIIKGAQIMSAWVLRTFSTREVVPMLTLLKSLVRSKVEYASILWSPTDARNIRNLENIQRRFTSKFAMFRRFNEATGFTECYADYWERLHRLKLYSLERRRERYMIMYMYQIHIGKVPDLGFISDYNMRTKTKYFAKYNHGATADVKAIRYSSFFTKGPLYFNLLPDNLREPVIAATPDEMRKLKAKFKRRLDKWLELIPDQPTTEGLDHRTADSNSIAGQMRMHGREVNRRWKIISKTLDQEEGEEDED